MVGGWLWCKSVRPRSTSSFSARSVYAQGGQPPSVRTCHKLSSLYGPGDTAPLGFGSFLPGAAVRGVNARSVHFCWMPPGCGAAGPGRLRPSLSGQGHTAFHGVCARSPSHRLAQSDCPPLPTTGVFRCFPCSSSGRRVGRGPGSNRHFPDEHLSHVCGAPGAPALRRGAVSCMHVRFCLAVLLDWLVALLHPGAALPVRSM